MSTWTEQDIIEHDKWLDMHDQYFFQTIDEVDTFKEFIYRAYRELDFLINRWYFEDLYNSYLNTKKTG